MRIEVVEVASDVFLVMGPRTNWCLMRDGDAVTLVDAAWPKDYPFVVDSLRQIGAAPEQVEAVVLTHAHPDHVGVAEQFRANHDAVVHTHRAEVGHATGQYHEHVRTSELVVRMWRPSVFAFAINAIGRGGSHPTPVAAVAALDDTPFEVPGGRLVPVPTPGHTSGHCSFHLPDHGVVITGDALVNHNLLTNRPGPRLMPSIFSHDPVQAAASLDRLATLDADVLVPGHGEPLHMTPTDAVKQAKTRVAGAGWWDR
jgi:glyoxylase-like metal-dependent hydrolase (beta-lactamase superfamily II)